MFFLEKTFSSSFYFTGCIKLYVIKENVLKKVFNQNTVYSKKLFSNLRVHVSIIRVILCQFNQ